MVADFNITFSNRQIVVPQGRILGLVGDRDVTECRFVYDRYYTLPDDNRIIDLSTYTAHVQCISANEESRTKDYLYATTGEGLDGVITEDPNDSSKLQFFWLLDEFVTQAPGEVQFGVQFIGFDAEAGAELVIRRNNLTSNYVLAESISQQLYRWNNGSRNLYTNTLCVGTDTPLYVDVDLSGRSMEDQIVATNGISILNTDKCTFDIMEGFVRNGQMIAPETLNADKLINGAAIAAAEAMSKHGVLSLTYGADGTGLQTKNKSQSTGLEGIALGVDCYAHIPYEDIEEWDPEGEYDYGVYVKDPETGYIYRQTDEHSKDGDPTNSPLDDTSVWSPIIAPVAMGVGNVAEGGAAFAEGSYTQALADYAHTEGRETYAEGRGAHAEGLWTEANGDWSHAEGASTYAHEHSSHTEGTHTNAYGKHAHAEGNNTIASDGASHAEGSDTIARRDSSHAEGYLTTANGPAAHTEGIGNLAMGTASHTEGGSFASDDKYPYNYFALTSLLGSQETITYEGKEYWALTYNMYDDFDYIGYPIIGAACAIYPDYPKSYEADPTWDDTHPHDEPGAYLWSYSEQQYRPFIYDYIFNNDIGRWQVRVAYKIPQTQYQRNHWNPPRTLYYYYGNTAYGINSHAEGSHTLAEELASHTEGSGTEARSPYTHAEGYNTTAWEDGAHTEGYSENHAIDVVPTIATADTNTIYDVWKQEDTQDGRHKYKFTVARGGGAHAEGKNTVALGKASHAEGDGSFVSAEANGGHGEGCGARVFAKYGHGEGLETTTGGEAGHTEGRHTNTTGKNAHAEGESSQMLEDIGGDLTTTQGIIDAWENSPFNLAEGRNSHTEGKDTLAIGDNSHAEGLRTLAYDQYDEYVSGTEIASSILDYNSANSYQKGSIVKGYYTDGRINYYKAKQSVPTNKPPCQNNSDKNTSYWQKWAYTYRSDSKNWAVNEIMAYNNVFWVCVKPTEPEVTGNNPDTAPDYWVRYNRPVGGVHSEGVGTISQEAGQHASGRYNNETNGARVTGNGTDDAHRSNAEVLDWNGNLTLAGNLTLGMGASAATLTPALIQAIGSGSEFHLYRHSVNLDRGFYVSFISTSSTPGSLTGYITHDADGRINDHEVVILGLTWDNQYCTAVYYGDPEEGESPSVQQSRSHSSLMPSYDTVTQII